jgi:hypothetical protein
LGIFHNEGGQRVIAGDDSWQANVLRARARRMALPRVDQSRGSLLPFEFSGLPFVPRRIFVVDQVPAGTCRGAHAHRSARQLLVCLAGRIEVELRDGDSVESVTLDDSRHGLLIEPGVWAAQTYLDTGSVLLVLSDESYDEAAYLERPAAAAPADSPSVDRQAMRARLRTPAAAGPDVTVCIPAWQAEAFIERTLSCARAQSYGNLRILVSIDHCEDATEAICRRQAERDPRIEVIAHRHRLGWSENCNAALDRVDTEFYCLYFHDDIIEPTYIERLRQALLAQPEASSAHCDMERFGTLQAIDPGNHYHGPDFRRLLNFMVGPVKGTPLRSLTRSNLLARGLRFPAIGEGGFWRCHPFLFQLLGAGPALHVPELLYRRWFRAGSMTTSWSVDSLTPLIEGQRASARLCLQIIDRLHASEEERQLLHYALRIFMMTWTRREELRLGGEQLIDPRELSLVFGQATAPPALASLDAELQAWLRQAQEELSSLEHSFAANASARRREHA